MTKKEKSDINTLLDFDSKSLNLVDDTHKIDYKSVVLLSPNLYVFMYVIKTKKSYLPD